LPNFDWTIPGGRLQIIHKIANMEEGNQYGNCASLYSPSVCFFLNVEGFKKLGLLPKKRNGANLWAKPCPYPSMMA
jgi:hypothetical protein